MTDDPVATALRDVRASLEGLRADLRAKDAEIARLREELAERESRIRGLGEQALHLLDLLQQARAAGPEPRP